MIDPRAFSKTRLVPPPPLPVISRRALKKIAHPVPIPTECNCCLQESVELVNNIEIYKVKSYGEWPYAYLCRECDAYVGLHPFTDIPLGTMADKLTRRARTTCKKPFEDIWKRKAMKRKEAYAWLAKELNISEAECHFGRFNVAQCEAARDACLMLLTHN